MTKLGKFLVYANLVLALFFLALGVGIATNRVDWPGTMKTGPASEVKAGIALKSEEIKNWQQAASLALGRYALAMPGIDESRTFRPLNICVLTISDIFDALSASDRPYKKAVPVEKALNILEAEVKDGSLDADLFNVFVQARVFDRWLVEPYPY